MKCIAADNVRMWRITAEPGDELLVELIHELDTIDAELGWLSGSGTVEDAVLAVTPNQGAGQAIETSYPGGSELVSLQGPVASREGAPPCLYATLAIEQADGIRFVAGRLHSATAMQVEMVVFASRPASGGGPVKSTRSAAPATPAAAPPATPAAPATPATPATPAAPTAPAAVPSPAPAVPSPGNSVTYGDDGPVIKSPPPARPPSTSQGLMAAAVPPARHKATLATFDEPYPEPDDTVTHFHFGECMVLESDGERIRLRQTDGGKVREVALSMLKIELASDPEATPPRHYRLLRKN